MQNVQNLHLLIKRRDFEPIKVGSLRYPSTRGGIITKNPSTVDSVDTKTLYNELREYKRKNRSDNDQTGARALNAMIREQELIFNIVEKNRLDILKKVVEIVGEEIPIDFNQINSSGNTILLTALMFGDAELVKYLIAKGVNVNQTLDNGETYLQKACRNGNIKMVLALIEMGADINQPRDDGETPLITAFNSGKYEIVSALIFSGLDLFIDRNREMVLKVLSKMINGKELLFYIVDSNRFDILKTVIEIFGEENSINFNQKDSSGNSILITACNKGDINMVEALIKMGADVNQAKKNGVTPLFIASQQGHIEVVKTLIEEKANVNQARDDGATPLYIACSKNHLEIANALFEAGANFIFLRKSTNCFGVFGLSYKLREFSPEMKKLIKKFIDPEQIKLRNKNIKTLNSQKTALIVESEFTYSLPQKINNELEVYVAPRPIEPEFRVSGVFGAGNSNSSRSRLQVSESGNVTNLPLPIERDDDNSAEVPLQICQSIKLSEPTRSKRVRFSFS